MGDNLVCPKCHERLWVGEMQIPLVTCPKCLARVVNPNAIETADASAPLEYRRPPRWVVPVEEESISDIQNTAIWVSFLTLLLFFGAVITALMMGFGVLSVLLIFCGLIVGGSVGVMHWLAPKEKEPAPSEHLHRVQRGDVTVFDYAAPRQENNAAIAGGFFLAMAISFATMIGTSAARDAWRPGAVAVFVIGVGSLIFIVVRAALNPQRRDFYRGLLIGSVLGSLGCGPCAAGMAFWG